jgi:hypothetical protein
VDARETQAPRALGEGLTGESEEPETKRMNTKHTLPLIAALLLKSLDALRRE